MGFEPFTLFFGQLDTGLIQPNNKISSFFHVLFLRDFLEVVLSVKFVDLLSDSFDLRFENDGLDLVLIEFLFNCFINESFGFL